MSRLTTFASIEASPAAARPLLEATKKQLGSVPNLFRVIASSPAALAGYVGLNGELAKGQLDARTRERIALAVAQVNGCDYCLAAHSYLGRNLARLDDTEIAANRAGHSNDPTADAAVRFAVRVVESRGHVADADLRCRDRRDRAAHRAEHADQLRQRGGQDQDRLPGRRPAHCRLTPPENKGDNPMSIRFIDENIHAWIDYPVAASLIGMPFVLGLGASNPLALWLSVGTGVAALLLTLFTDHKLGVIRVLPYWFHLAVDRLVGVTFAMAPFALGFTGLDALYYWANAAAVLAVTFLLNLPARPVVHGMTA
jgi:AhpD family alkylhydroperoxidase